MATPEETELQRREALLLRQLFRAFTAINDETNRRLQAKSSASLQPSFARLLGNLDAAGTRISALARRMSVSRQAVSQLVVELAARGFVQRDPDPSDERGVIVRFTAKGKRALGDAIAIMTEVEKEYVDRIGDKSAGDLRRGLHRLVSEIDADGKKAE